MQYNLLVIGILVVTLTSSMVFCTNEDDDKPAIDSKDFINEDEETEVHPGSSVKGITIVTATDVNGAIIEITATPGEDPDAMEDPAMEDPVMEDPVGEVAEDPQSVVDELTPVLVYTNCSHTNDTEKRKAHEDFENRFKDTFTWNLKYGDPCGPEKRCNFKNLGLVCIMDMEEEFGDNEPTCNCDIADPKRSQWSFIQNRCSGKDYLPCSYNDECASNKCNYTTGRCNPAPAGFDYETEAPDEISTASTPLPLHQFLSFIAIILFSLFAIQTIQNPEFPSQSIFQ